LANIESGARGRAAGVVGILVLGTGMAISEPWLARIPLPAVAGVLVLVAIALMSGFKALDLKKPRQTVELLATVLVAVFFGLFYAVLTGAGLAFYHRALDHPQKHMPPILEDS